MTVVCPDLSVPGATEKAWELVRQVLRNPPSPGSGWKRRIIQSSTAEQRNRIVELLRPLATASFTDPSTRKFFAIACDLGANDLDVTSIVDEVLRYQKTTDSVCLEMIESDQLLLLDVIHPTNFSQFNRYLKLESRALINLQIEFLRKAAKNKAFRTAPEFQWLSTSRFATIPETAYAVSFIGQTGPISWDREEEASIIDAIKTQPRPCGAKP